MLVPIRIGLKINWRVIFLNVEEIKWISYYGKDISAVNQSFREKLKQYGFCLVLDEYGSDKASKAQLSILDAIQGKGTPNILLVCPKHLMHNWYRSIVTNCGVDFKMISGASRSINNFDANMSNMFIVAEDAVKKGNPILAQFEQTGLVWDLIIIDGGLNIAGVNSSLYLDHIKSKTDKLVVFSPVPCEYECGYDEIKNLVKGLMKDEEKSKAVDDVVFSKRIISFNPYEPVMRYYNAEVYNGEVSRNVVMVNYSFPEDFVAGARKLVDIKTGLPLYQHGGNVFEEYGLEAKRIYTKPAYNLTDVKDLRAVDKKLDCFLTKLDEVMSDPSAKAVVYCVTGSTITYLKKVLSVIYSNSGNIIKVDRGDIFNTRYDQFTEAAAVDNTRIALTVDEIGSIKPSIKTYTHIFNYELPDNPVVLEQRAARHNVEANNGKEFILFCDDNGVFDGRMLSKVLFDKIYSSLVQGLPGRNVLFDVPGAVDFLVKGIRDLQYVCGYTGEVSGSRDVVTQFKGDFNIAPSIDLPNSTKTHEYTANKLQKIYRALGIADQIKDNSTDEKTLKSIIKPVINSYKDTLLYLDEDMRIVPVSAEELKSCLNHEGYSRYKAMMETGELSMGLKKAQDALDYFTQVDKYADLRACVGQLEDVMKMPVLLGAWRYLTDKNIIKDSFRDFMKSYNEGVM